MEIILLLAIAVYFIFTYPVIGWGLLALLTIGIILGICMYKSGVNVPSGHRRRSGYHRRSSTSILGTVFRAQARTEKRNGSSRGVMSASSRVGARGGRLR